ncbi:hypothetical protein BASA61_007950 [Batrachochytrium salamandrivorans]|nr:hypothetical protein BASA61_007950 [Batrachochytrium salamandrivorans]
MSKVVGEQPRTSHDDHYELQDSHEPRLSSTVAGQGGYVMSIASRPDTQLPRSKLHLWSDSPNDIEFQLEQFVTNGFSTGISDSLTVPSTSFHIGGASQNASIAHTPIFAKVKSDYTAQGPDELNLEEEDIIRMLSAPATVVAQPQTALTVSGVKANTATAAPLSHRANMSIGSINGLVGWFPTSIIRILNDEEVHLEGLHSSDSMTDLHQSSQILSRQTSVVCKHDSNDPLDSSPARTTQSITNPPDRTGGGANTTTGTASTSSAQGMLAQSNQQQIQTRNWYNKYRAMPRYEKKGFSASFSVSNDPIEATLQSSSSVRERSPSSSGTSSTTQLQTESAEPHVPGHRSEKSWWSGSARQLSGSPSVPSISSIVSTNAGGAKVAILGAPAFQRQLWVDFVGGPEAVEALGLSKKEIKRQEVIFEIITTESDYLDDLDIICEAYSKQLKRNKLIRSKDMAIIFSNIEQLLPVNMELLKSLVKRQEANKVIEHVGDVFIRVSDYLKMYTMYCSNHPYALIKLQSVRQNKSVAKFLDQCAQHPDCRNLNLANFLLKPVQRVCKYPLFLRELIKATEPDHVDSENLVKALLKIETVVTIINEGARQTENVHKMLELQSKFLTRVNLVAPSRVMVKNGPVDVRNTQNEFKPRQVYLFNDMLLIAKPDGDKYKLMHMIPFDMILVNSSHDTAESECQIEIVHVGSARCTFIFDNPALKEGWITAIKNSVDEWISQKTRMNTVSSHAKEASTTVCKDDGDVDAEAEVGSRHKAVPSTEERLSTPFGSSQNISQNNIYAETSFIPLSGSCNNIKSTSGLHRTCTSETLLPLNESTHSSTTHTSEPAQDGMSQNISLLAALAIRRPPPPVPEHRALDSIELVSAAVDGSKPPIVRPSPSALQMQKMRLLKGYNDSKSNMGRGSSSQIKPPEESVKRAKNMIVQVKHDGTASASNSHLRSATADPSLSNTSLASIDNGTSMIAGVDHKKGTFKEGASTTQLISRDLVELPQTRTRSATDQPFRSEEFSHPTEKSDIDNKISASDRLSSNSINDQGNMTNSSPPSKAAVAASNHPTTSSPLAPRGGSSYSTKTQEGSSVVNIHRYNTSINKPVKEAKIIDLKRGPGSGVKSFLYVMSISYIGMPDLHTGSVSQSFDTFFDLHLQLVGHFPEAAGISTGAEVIRASGGKSDAKRILPELPGQMMFVSEAVARGRIAQLQQYLDVLLSLPSKISRSPVVLKFFRPT